MERKKERKSTSLLFGHIVTTTSDFNQGFLSTSIAIKDSERERERERGGGGADRKTERERERERERESG